MASGALQAGDARDGGRPVGRAAPLRPGWGSESAQPRSSGQCAGAAVRDRAGGARRVARGVLGERAAGVAGDGGGAGRAPRHVATERVKVNVVGGGLLAVALGLAVVRLCDPDPEHAVLPPWGGSPMLAGAAVALVAFVLWEWRARGPADRSGERADGRVPRGAGRKRGGGGCRPSMITLVDVDLFGQTLLDKDDGGGVLILVRFLIALPVGAVSGGWLAGKVTERWVTVAGMLVAAAGYQG